MYSRRDILLTGATGFLGRYLMCDLLAGGRPIVALVRGSSEAAADRIAPIIAWWGDQFGTTLTPPRVLGGDLTADGLGLDAADRRRIGRCGAILHAAARVGFERSSDGEPNATNVEGTRRLLELCRSLRLTEFHHVSTAFVCGDRTGTIREDDLECGQGFHNDYERSKYEAERLVRTAEGVRATVYRPTVIVGDSRTGYTSSYHGLYSFLELADRVAAPADWPADDDGRPLAHARQLALRLPFIGDEPRDFVPVDWVSRAIVNLIHRPRWHGRTFHLAAARPLRMREITEAAQAVLGLEGVRWMGGDQQTRPTRLEQLVFDHFRAYWPYLGGDAVFDRRNTRRAALPPPPRLDRLLLARLIRFARADRWGRGKQAGRCDTKTELDCADYVERFLPANAPRSSLAGAVALDLTVAVEIRGPGGGRWSCRWVRGNMAGVRRGLDGGAAVTYRTDPATFAAIVHGRETPREAFFARRIEVEGDVEKGLKLALLLESFIKEFPYQPGCPREALDVSRCGA